MRPPDGCDSLGCPTWAEVCWDGKSRTTAKIVGGTLSYLERFASFDTLRAAERYSDGAPRCPCDYL
jgi:hypothetical protein